jgi:hypothetical protein
MKPTLLILASLLVISLGRLHATILTLSAPLDYQVNQRESKGKGALTIGGNFADADSKGDDSGSGGMSFWPDPQLLTEPCS